MRNLGNLPEAVQAAVPTDEAACVARLAEIRWGQGAFQCRVCLSTEWSAVAGRPRVRRCRLCRHHTSVTAGTLLHRSRVDLRVWFLAAALLTRPEGCQSRELAECAGIHVQSAWRILHRLRRATTSGARLLLRGAVTSSGSAIALRRPRGRHSHKMFRALSDAHGAHVYRAVGLRQVHRIAARHAPHLEPFSVRMRRDDAASAWQGPGRQIRERHHGVSELWLPHYLAALEFAHNHAGGEVVGAVLRRALVHRASRFIDLEPPRPPTWLRVREPRPSPGGGIAGAPPRPGQSDCPAARAAPGCPAPR